MFLILLTIGRKKNVISCPNAPCKPFDGALKITSLLFTITQPSFVTAMTKKMTLFCLLIVGIDLLIKAYIHQNWQIETFYKPFDFLTIARMPLIHPPDAFEQLPFVIVKTFRYALRWLMIILLCRLPFLQIHRRYRYAVTLIAFGAIGNFTDGLLFMKEQKHYVQLNYFSWGSQANLFFNLSDGLLLIGWGLFAFALITNIREAKKLFSRAKKPQGTI